MAKLLRWRGKQIAARPRQILGDYGPLISFQLQEEIATEQFNYPVPTVRKNGNLIPAGKRDIIDTGLFLNSQTNPEITSGRGYSILNVKWTAPYSGAILQGGYLVGTVRNNYIAPPRDWITPALRKRPLLPYFATRWKALATPQRR